MTNKNEVFKPCDCCQQVNDEVQTCYCNGSAIWHNDITTIDLCPRCIEEYEHTGYTVKIKSVQDLMQAIADATSGAPDPDK